MIRGKPAQRRSTVGAPKNRQRILSVHRSGWSRNAGPQQWYGGIRSTLRGSPLGASARSIVTPPPSASYSASESTGGARGLGNSVRPVSPPGTRFPDAVGRPGGQSGDISPPVSPFGPALVSVLPRVDRAVRTVPPAVCSHVRCAGCVMRVLMHPLTDA